MDDKVGEIVKKQNVTKCYRKLEVVESHDYQRAEGTRHIDEKKNGCLPKTVPNYQQEHISKRLPFMF